MAVERDRQQGWEKTKREERWEGRVGTAEQKGWRAPVCGLLS